MTTYRIYDILKSHTDSLLNQQSRLADYIRDAMTQAVNEAIQECADSVDKYGPYLNQNGGTKVITNLKVK